MKEHKFHQPPPKRCRKCRGKVNVFSNNCYSCGEPWTPSRDRVGKAGYEPEPTTPAPAIALTFRDYDDEPLDARGVA